MIVLCSLALAPSALSEPSTDAAPSSLGTALRVPASAPPLQQGDEFVPYVLDPLLQDAHAAFLNEDLPREQAITLFEKYAQENPQSEFLPEICVQIGALYSVNKHRGEETDVEKQVYYYQKAHALYGQKVSYLHLAAWATLANRSDSLDEKFGYYDWLRKISTNLQPEDIWPVREIGQLMNGRWPTIEPTQIAKMIDGLGRNLPQYINVSEKNIVSSVRNDAVSLALCVDKYPDTNLGNLAKARLQQLTESRDGEDLDELSRSSADSEKDFGAEVVEESGGSSFPAEKIEVEPKASSEHAGAGADWIWIVAALSALAAAIIGYRIVARYGKARGTSSGAGDSISSTKGKGAEKR